MEALSHADCATVENLDGIDSRNSEGNEVKWGDDDWQLVRRERPPSVLSSYKRLGYWASLANFLPTAHACYVGRISSS
jgi:hypothetical protein